MFSKNIHEANGEKLLRFITNVYKNEAFIFIYGETLLCTGSSVERNRNRYLCLLLLAEEKAGNQMERLASNNGCKSL